jgi:hypothetical protein
LFFGHRKSEASGGTRPAGVGGEVLSAEFRVMKVTGNRPNFNTAGPGRQPACFLYSSKESMQRNDVRYGS